MRTSRMDRSQGKVVKMPLVPYFLVSGPSTQLIWCATTWRPTPGFTLEAGPVSSLADVVAHRQTLAVILTVAKP